MTIETLKAALTEKGIQFEEGVHRCGWPMVGVKTGRFLWSWFYAYAADDAMLFFDHTYCQNRGRTMKGFRHGYEKRGWIEKKLGQSMNADAVAPAEVVAVTAVEETPKEELSILIAKAEANFRETVGPMVQQKDVVADAIKYAGMSQDAAVKMYNRLCGIGWTGCVIGHSFNYRGGERQEVYVYTEYTKASGIKIGGDAIVSIKSGRVIRRNKLQRVN